MASMKSNFKIFYLGFFLMIMFMIVGCGQNIRKQTAAFDTPEHHVVTGFKLFDSEQFNDAQKEFTLALELEPRCAMAHLGAGLVQALNKHYRQSSEHISLAKRYSRDNTERSKAHVGFMRLHMLREQKGWLAEVEHHFNSAVGYFTQMPNAHYYMGVAYREASRLEDAQKEFKKVLEIEKKDQALITKANMELKKIQEIERARIGSGTMSKLAVQDRISRADVAALFVQELKVDKTYFKNRNLAIKAIAEPEDVKNHTLRADIVTMLKIGLRGLEVFPNGKFNPDAFVIRKEFVMMLEDIIGGLTQDNTLGAKFFSCPSPFSDVRSDEPHFNAVILCTTRGLMGTEDLVGAAFNPDGYVRGADAVLAVRKLKKISESAYRTH